ncbi:hypothetical protein ACIBTV_06065 [Micromonospora sp. NPDC049366]|uniref:hypothetical protein n=1 Tax=Micromonospora sp. NPDC049366 TaxID=3364271 RepID=UPI00379B8400
MTTYRRRGHWRRSPGGGRHWVQTHSVTRSGASRPSRQTYGSPYRRTVTARPRVPRPPRSFSERWLRPNARCPVCGASVFYYSNEHGSRVFFDEVGPPWPKHPCTDNSAYRERSPISPGRSAPARYSLLKGRSLAQRSAFLDATANSRLTWVGLSYRVNAWTPYALLKRDLADGVTRLTLQRLYTLQPATVWTVAAEVPLAVGDVVFVQAGQLSYFDLDRGEPVTMPVEHVGTERVGGVRERLRGLWTRLTS